MVQNLRIDIDARYLSHGLVGGVHTYLRNLSLALVDLDSASELVFWIDEKAQFDIAGANSAIQTRVLPWRNPLSSIQNDLRIGNAMLRDGATVAHFPANYGMAPAALPTVVTIHDVINLLPIREIIRGHQKSPKTMAMMTYLHLMTRASTRRQLWVITVSEHSKQEILDRTNLHPERVRVVYSAPDPDFRTLPPEDLVHLRCRLGLRKHVVLADAIKNPDATLQAYRELPASVRRRTSLVFFSRRQPSPEVLRSKESGESTLVLQPSRDDLVKLFNIADVFIFPSWYEGFGLPPLEAMACGTPAIVSSRGSLPEIVGDAGIVASVDDYAAMARAITMIVDDEGLSRELSQRAVRRASEFSWKRAATNLMGIYSEAASSSREVRLHHVSKGATN